MLTVQELDKVTEELWETAKNVFTLGEEEKYTFGVGVTLTLMYMNEYDNKEVDECIKTSETEEGNTDEATNNR